MAHALQIPDVATLAYKTCPAAKHALPEYSTKNAQMFFRVLSCVDVLELDWLSYCVVFDENCTCIVVATHVFAKNMLLDVSKCDIVCGYYCEVLPGDIVRYVYKLSCLVTDHHKAFFESGVSVPLSMCGEGVFECVNFEIGYYHFSAPTTYVRCDAAVAQLSKLWCVVELQYIALWATTAAFGDGVVPVLTQRGFPTCIASLCTGALNRCLFIELKTTGEDRTSGIKLPHRGCWSNIRDMQALLARTYIPAHIPGMWHAETFESPVEERQLLISFLHLVANNAAIDEAHMHTVLESWNLPTVCLPIITKAFCQMYVHKAASDALFSKRLQSDLQTKDMATPLCFEIMAKGISLEDIPVEWDVYLMHRDTFPFKHLLYLGIWNESVQCMIEVAHMAGYDVSAMNNFLTGVCFTTTCERGVCRSKNSGQFQFFFNPTMLDVYVGKAGETHLTGRTVVDADLQSQRKATRELCLTYFASLSLALVSSVLEPMTPENASVVIMSLFRAERETYLRDIYYTMQDNLREARNFMKKAKQLEITGCLADVTAFTPTTAPANLPFVYIM